MARLTAKVSQKGAVSVIGLGRFPVTLYADQWKALVPCGAAILAFIAAEEKAQSGEHALASEKTAKAGSGNLLAAVG